MTARQRSKHDSSYVENLMVLPEGMYRYIYQDLPIGWKIDLVP